MTEAELFHGYRNMSLHDGGYRIAQVRAMLIERDGPFCRRCTRMIRFDLSGLHPWGPTIGHIVPVYDGGTDDLRNLRLEHRRCNLAASNRPDPPRAALAQAPR